jgi:NADPH-dependent 7-cyano-7-deazaguanine reductase QueF-like protein
MESLASWLLSWIEVKKGKQSLAITEINEQIQSIGLVESSTGAIGFVIPDEKEDEE